MTINIIEYNKRSFEDCVRLFHRVYNEIYPNLDKSLLDFNRFTILFKDYILPHSQTFIAKDGKSVVGFISVAPNFIDQLYIDAKYRSNGLGTILVEKAKELYPDKLDLYTLASNEKAILFYQKQKFKVIKYGISPDEKVADVFISWKADEKYDSR